MATGLALTLVALVFGTLQTAAQPSLMNVGDLHLFSSEPINLLVGQQQELTSTPTVSSAFPNPAVPLDQLPPNFVPALAETNVIFPSSPLPAWAQALLNGDDLQLAATGEISVVKIVDTSLTAGSVDQSTVLNGEAVTYTIRVTNPGTATAALENVSIVDVFPENTLVNVSCVGSGDCNVFTETRSFDDPFGGPIQVGIPRFITSSVGSLAPGQSAEVIFQGTVSCRADGAVFKNQALVSYEKSGEFKSDQSNEVETVVRVQPDRLSSQPTACSEEVGGAYDLDWGDFDNDGDLDVALAATSLGTVVYQNDSGEVQRFWGDERFTFAVRWADVNNDNQLELLALSGPTANNFSNMSGIIYEQTGDTFTQIGTFAENKSGLLHLEPADYDRDGDIEVVVSSYFNSDPPCTTVDGDAEPGFFFFENDGQGNLTVDPDIPRCLAIISVRGIAWGDYDNDGFPDLAVGGAINKVFINDGSGQFTNDAANTVDFTPGTFILDLAWGDYDGDGFLDLAAGDNPGSTDALIYHRDPQGGFAPPVLKDVTGFQQYGVEWADFNSDGHLELALSGEPTRIYVYNNVADTFPEPPFATLPTLTAGGEIWRIQAADPDSDGDLDLSIGNVQGQSALFTAFAPLLSRSRTLITQPVVFPSLPASSVAWGDADGDGELDLLFGGGPPPAPGSIGAKLYINQSGSFPNNPGFFGSFGPHIVSFGDIEGDGDLDIALGTTEENQIYRNNGSGSYTLFWTSNDAKSTTSLAWADYDDDFDLDLAVGNDGQVNQVYRYNEEGDDFELAWTSSGDESNTTSVAWADFDGDLDFDLAIGNRNQSNQIYQNDSGMFTLVWTSTQTFDTRAVAWADYDGDGDLDLAVGNYDQPNVIYENLAKQNPSNPTLTRTPSFTLTNIFNQPLSNNTTSLAWGDWDNDGDLDLAVGNEGEVDQVFANLSTPSNSQMQLLWRSNETLNTTGVAWGDKDDDGDLDLAISQDGDALNGFYENFYVSPSHLTNDFHLTIPLPNNNSYLSIDRPGRTPDADFYSSPEVLSGQVTPTINVNFKLFDPDGTRDIAVADAVGDRLLTAIYEYSLDGGGTWQTASQATGLPDPDLTTSRLGRETIFHWDAQKDGAISDNAHFRITIIPQASVGLTQQAPPSAISPPFRVRGLTCVWPRNPSINSPDEADVGEQVTFQGILPEGSGVVTFTWDFGDGKTTDVVTNSQSVKHIYDANNTYTVTLTVSGQPCPITKPVSVTKQISIGTGVPDKLTYLPLIIKSGGSPPTSAEEDRPILTLQSMPDAPSQVTGLSGDSQAESGRTTLTWAANPPEEGVRAYAIYRAATDASTFRRLAEVPAETPTYTDDTSGCGQMYLITALNEAGESLPSTASYFTLPCR